MGVLENRRIKSRGKKNDELSLLGKQIDALNTLKGKLQTITTDVQKLGDQKIEGVEDANKGMLKAANKQLTKTTKELTKLNEKAKKLEGKIDKKTEKIKDNQNLVKGTVSKEKINRQPKDTNKKEPDGYNKNNKKHFFRRSKNGPYYQELEGRLNSRLQQVQDISGQVDTLTKFSTDTSNFTDPKLEKLDKETEKFQKKMNKEIEKTQKKFQKKQTEVVKKIDDKMKKGAKGSWSHPASTPSQPAPTHQKAPEMTTQHQGVQQEELGDRTVQQQEGEPPTVNLGDLTNNKNSGFKGLFRRNATTGNAPPLSNPNQGVTNTGGNSLATGELAFDDDEDSPETLPYDLMDPGYNHQSGPVIYPPIYDELSEGADSTIFQGTPPMEQYVNFSSVTDPVTSPEPGSQAEADLQRQGFSAAGISGRVYPPSEQAFNLGTATDLHPEESVQQATPPHTNQTSPDMDSLGAVEDDKYYIDEPSGRYAVEPPAASQDALKEAEILGRVMRDNGSTHSQDSGSMNTAPENARNTNIGSQNNQRAK